MKAFEFLCTPDKDYNTLLLSHSQKGEIVENRNALFALRRAANLWKISEKKFSSFLFENFQIKT